MPKQRPYKEISIQQLRSFCETARLLSFKAAADALGLSHPTVWEQVHALQRNLGTILVEPHGRGCRITPDGAALVQLIGPVVASVDSLKLRFLESRKLAPQRLIVVSTPRTLVEDLPQVLARFEKSHPQVEVCLKEADTLQVAEMVESKEADLGITVDRSAELRNSGLALQPCYDLDLVLLTRQDHPLARVKRITPAQLRRYPFVNGKIPEPAIQASIEKLRLFETQPRRVEARINHVIRHYVKLNYGIGLVASRLGLRENRGLHERSLSKYFGRFQVHAVWRKGNESEYQRAFVDLLHREFT